MFNPSKYQTAIRDWFQRGIGSAIVQAVPGSGKTTTLIWLLTSLYSFLKAKRVLLTSFGKKTVTTLEAKLRAALGAVPNCWTIKTLNGLGNGSVVAHLVNTLGVPRKAIELHGATNFRGYKVPEKSMCILWDMFPKGSNGKRPNEYFIYGNFVKRLVSLAKNEGIGALVPDETQAWLNLIAYHGLWLPSKQGNEARAVEIAQDVLRTSNLWAQQGKLDFDDQLYLVSLWDLELPKQDFILSDEQQDTNRIQLDMLRRMSTPDTRALLVGDERQSIYGFRGADANAMTKAQDMFKAQPLPLSICYRCSKAVIDKANDIAARWYCIKQGIEYNAADWQGEKAVIQAADNAPEGEVKELETYSADTFKSTDAVLCRNVAPLVKLAYQFIRKQIACHVLGRDIGQNLVQLVKQMDAANVEDLENKLREYQARETGKALDRDRQSEADAINDRCDCVRLFIDNLTEGNRTVEAVTVAISKLFSDTEGTLTLSTVHRAKGLEYPQVFILDNALMPSKYAEQEHQLEQEYNLMFVAYSRAMLNMYFITSDGWTDTPAQDEGEAVTDLEG